jgi:hypothetical protein
MAASFSERLALFLEKWYSWGDRPPFWVIRDHVLLNFDRIRWSYINLQHCQWVVAPPSSMQAKNEDFLDPFKKTGGIVRQRV